MQGTKSEATTIGERLVELCKSGNGMTALDELYSPNIVSVEAMGSPECAQVMEGIDAIRGKNEWWYENNELHGMEVEGPFPNGDRFAVTFKIDTTPKAGPMAGQRMQMHEMALYTVDAGKIIREEFFYDMGC